MKVFVQIPCLNEEATLPLVLQSIPKKVTGVDELTVLIVDDGSTDSTVEIAKQHGVTHFVYHRRNRGLARSFFDGVEYALEHGADIVINTDGDNQYPQEKIADLLRPILDGKADIVIADRQTHTIEHFSPLKKLLQRLGSRVVNYVAGTDLPDAPSGFRAYSKEALLVLNPISRFSYAMETIIQAGNKNLKIVSVPITTNPKTRESRLFSSTWEHVRKSGMAIVRSYIMYKPYAIFGTLGVGAFIIGIIPEARFLYFALLRHESRGHLQSLVIGSTLLVGALLCLALNILADLIRTNRILQEQELEHLKRMRFRSLDDAFDD